MPYHGNQLFPLGDDAPPRKLPEPDGVAFNIVPQDGSSSQTKSKVEMVEIKKKQMAISIIFQSQILAST